MTKSIESTQYLYNKKFYKIIDISLKETLALLAQVTVAVSRKLGYGKQPEKSLSGDLSHAGVAEKSCKLLGDL